METRRLFCLICFLFLASGCRKSQSEPTAAPLFSYTPIAVSGHSENLKWVDCPFQAPEGMPSDMMPDIQCANLTVLEDRRQTNGPTIDLAVAIVKTTSTTPKADPVLILFGNPVYGLDLAPSLPYILNNIYDQRDLIIIDQRGTGFSQPSFSCPEFSNLSYESWFNNLNWEDGNNRYIEASRICAGNMKVSGVNLSAYTTTAVAADLEELRQTLGISQWNIYTLFDGSRLALTMMRDYPQGIRSVVLDSVVPPQADPIGEQGNNVEQVLDRLFQYCAEDEQCNKAYPNLKQVFFTLLDQLDTQPISIDVADLNSGVKYKVSMDGERLVSFIMGLINIVYDPGALPEIPRMIYQLQDGNTDVAERLLGAYSMYNPNILAMGQWVACNEENYFSNPELITKANQNLDLFLGKFFEEQVKIQNQACTQWEVSGVPAIENQPVSSDIPALLLAGEFDWSAPPAWADLAAQTLSNSTVVEFAGTGQVVYLSPIWSDCAHKIVDAFLETPTARPNTTCAAKPVNLLWITLK